MFCWKCQTEFIISSEKISFRAICEHCGAWLHVCKQCRHHAPGKPNECNVPGTDYIADREMANYCEEFSPKLTKTESSKNKEEVKRKLFGEEGVEHEKPMSKEGGFFKLFKEDDNS